MHNLGCGTIVSSRIHRIAVQRSVYASLRNAARPSPCYPLYPRGVAMVAERLGAGVLGAGAV